MEKRMFGRTGHASTVITFGGASLGRVSQEEADVAVQLMLDHGVNQIDVAPSYGEAELRLGPWLKRYRDRFFLCCKTGHRTRKEAWEELHCSLERVQVESFDVYQFHGLDTLEELDVVLGPGGAMEAVLEAREKGLLRFIGVTGHRPDTHLAALQRLDFDTVLCPVNVVVGAHLQPKNDWRPLLKLAAERNVGVMAMKALGKQPWGEDEHCYNTWYRPFDDQERIDRAIWFTLSQGVATATSAADVHLLPMILSAAERFQPLSAERQLELTAEASALEPIFPR